MSELLTTNDTSADHSEFNLEWAKRGGVFIGANNSGAERLYKVINHYGDGLKVIDIVSNDVGYCATTTSCSDYGCEVDICTPIRMATPDECKHHAESGFHEQIEYIPPPPRFEFYGWYEEYLELNMGNYTDDQVRDLTWWANQAFCLLCDINNTNKEI